MAERRLVPLAVGKRFFVLTDIRSHFPKKYYIPAGDRLLQNSRFQGKRNSRSCRPLVLPAPNGGEIPIGIGAG